MKSTRIRFKSYHQNQVMAIPPTFDELIPKEHPVRIVNQIIDKINIDVLLKQYKGGGCSSYHPRMLLKILVYGYLCNIYSSRKLENAVKENIHFMWLAAMEQPDHNTINRFRSDRLNGVIKKIFTQVVLLMAESGHVDLQKVYTDGTKIESQSNRYTFVWGKRIKNARERISKQLECIWTYAQEIAKEELKDTAPISFDTTDPEAVRRTIEHINELLQDKPVDKAVKKKLAYARKHWVEKLEQYNKDEEILGDRNSYSKTDKDATFMRMKEDHMKNGQLKPAYNTQISTNNQIIIHYSIHQNPNDTKTLIPHIESFEQAYNSLPQELTADAGYGSEENYEFMEQHQIEAYVKYNYFDKEQREKEKAKPSFHIDNLHYNKEQNCYYCPMGQRMNFIGNKTEITETGFKKTLSRYQATNCEGCPLRGACHKGKNNRIIEVNHRLNELKAAARERLLSEKGKEHRKKRPVDVEPVFGMIKQNKAFRRFLLKGLDKVNIEFGLVAMAHNIMKFNSIINAEPFFVNFFSIFRYAINYLIAFISLFFKNLIVVTTKNVFTSDLMFFYKKRLSLI